MWGIHFSTVTLSHCHRLRLPELLLYKAKSLLAFGNSLLCKWKF